MALLSSLASFGKQYPKLDNTMAPNTAGTGANTGTWGSNGNGTESSGNSVATGWKPPPMTGFTQPPPTGAAGNATMHPNVSTQIHANEHAISPNAQIGGGYGTGAGGYYSGFNQGNGASDGSVDPAQEAYVNSIRTARGMPSLQDTRAMRQQSRMDQQNMNQEGGPRMPMQSPIQGFTMQQLRGNAPAQDPQSVEQFKQSLAGMPPQQAGSAIFGKYSTDSNSLLRFDEPQLQSALQAGQAQIAQYQAAMNNPAFNDPQQRAIYEGYIKDAQSKIDRINSAIQMRSQIGPYMQYLPKMANGQDIDWQQMMTNPQWAESLPEEVKQALYGMHIGEYAQQVVSGH